MLKKTPKRLQTAFQEDERKAELLKFDAPRGHGSREEKNLTHYEDGEVYPCEVAKVRGSAMNVEIRPRLQTSPFYVHRGS